MSAAGSQEKVLLAPYLLYPWLLASLNIWSQQGPCYAGAVLPPCPVLTGAELPEARGKPTSTVFPALMAPGLPAYLASAGSL